MKVRGLWVVVGMRCFSEFLRKWGLFGCRFGVVEDSGRDFERPFWWFVELEG